MDSMPPPPPPQDEVKLDWADLSSIAVAAEVAREAEEKAAGKLEIDPGAKPAEEEAQAEGSTSRPISPSAFDRWPLWTQENEEELARSEAELDEEAASAKKRADDEEAKRKADEEAVAAKPLRGASSGRLEQAAAAKRRAEEADEADSKWKIMVNNTALASLPGESQERAIVPASPTSNEVVPFRSETPGLSATFRSESPSGLAMTAFRSEESGFQLARHSHDIPELPEFPEYETRERRQSVASVESMQSMQSRLSMTDIGAPNKAQWCLSCTACFTTLWVISSGAIIILATQVYGCDGINDARERYAVTAAVRAGAQASEVLRVGLSARDAAEYAINRKLYFEPMDYDAARATVEALLRAAPQLRAVDLAFVGRNESLTVRRLPDGQMVVMSDDTDCYQRLGSLGCSSAKPARERVWYMQGLNLAAGAQATEAGGTAKETSATFEWYGNPGFMPATMSSRRNSTSAPATAPSYNYLEWVPAYSLVFRSVFPGTAGSLALLGRVTLDVSDLREQNRLYDSMLGPKGAMYVCDKYGTLISAADPGETVIINSPSGSVRFRYVWELAALWAKGTTKEDFQGGGRRFIADNVQVVIAPLRETGLEHFSVVVAADREFFEDKPLLSTSLMGEVLVGMPYVMVCLVFLLWFCARCYERRLERKSLRRVHPGRSSRSSGTAYLGRTLGTPD